MTRHVCTSMTVNGVEYAVEGDLDSEEDTNASTCENIEVDGAGIDDDDPQWAPAEAALWVAYDEGPDRMEDDYC